MTPLAVKSGVVKAVRARGIGLYASLLRQFHDSPDGVDSDGLPKNLHRVLHRMYYLKLIYPTFRRELVATADGPKAAFHATWHYGPPPEGHVHAHRYHLPSKPGDVAMKRLDVMLQVLQSRDGVSVEALSTLWGQKHTCTARRALFDLHALRMVYLARYLPRPEGLGGTPTPVYRFGFDRPDVAARPTEAQTRARKRSYMMRYRAERKALREGSPERQQQLAVLFALAGQRSNDESFQKQA